MENDVHAPACFDGGPPVGHVSADRLNAQGIQLGIAPTAEHADAVSPGEQLLDEVSPQKPPATGDQCVHGILSCLKSGW